MILIIYEDADLSTLTFIDYCKQNLLPHKAVSIASLAKEDVQIIDSPSNCLWKLAEQEISFNNIRGIYLRCQYLPMNSFSDYHQNDRPYVQKEWWSYLVYTMAKHPNCINAITNETISNVIAELPFFLNCAKKAGLLTPQHLFSQSFRELEGIFNQDDKRYLVAYSLIPTSDFRASSAINANAIGLIEYIKGLPILVHIVGENVFACTYTKSDRTTIILEEGLRLKCLKMCHNLSVTIAQIIFIQSEIDNEKYLINFSVIPNWDLNNKNTTLDIFNKLYQVLLQTERM